MVKDKVKSALFLLLGVTLSSVLPTFAATNTVNTFSGATGLYQNTFASGDTLNITANINATSDIGNYLGAKTLTFNGNGHTINGSTTATPTRLGFVVQSGGNYGFDTVTLKVFKSTSNTQGGALTVNSGATASLVNSTVTLNVNSNANGTGGAVFNSGTLNLNAGNTFSGNYDSGASGVGGAIYNSGATATTTITNNSFLYNGFSNYNGTNATTVKTLNGGAIYNTNSGTVNITNTTFNNNAATTYGGAIYNNSGTVNIGTSGSNSDTSSFTNNYTTIATGEAGAIYNNNGTLHSYGGVTYAGNYGIKYGAIYNFTGGTATFDHDTFKYNGFSDYATNGTSASNIVSQYAGAINTDGITTITNSTFNNNTAIYVGGAIGNSGTLTIGTSGGTDTSSFINNYIATDYGSGGAIYNDNIAHIYKGVTFAGNYTPTANYSGGAIYNNGTMTIDGATFKYNGYSDYDSINDKAYTVSTSNGGAIFNDSAGSATITNSTFNSNASTSASGAIANGGTMYIGTSGSTDTTSFINNYVGGSGAAIGNWETLKVYQGVLFAGNHSDYSGGAVYSNAGTATFTGDTFKYNGFDDYNGSMATNVTTYIGGAFHNDADGTLNIINSTINNNASTANGGAIYNSTYEEDDEHGNFIAYHIPTLNIIGTQNSIDTTYFTNNYSQGGNGGAIWNSGVLNSYSGVIFAGNYTSGQGADGGALFNSSSHGITTIIGNTFKYNGFSNYNSGTDTASTVSTYNGGAIYNDFNATLNIKNSTFTNNAAFISGGAIANNYGILNIGTSGDTDSTTFTKNYCTYYIDSSSGNPSYGSGGAIANWGTLNIYSGVKFVGNYVLSSVGGAIDNEGTAIIDGAKFRYNGYSNYNPGNDTASAVASSSGGAIYNGFGSTLNITNSLFNNNAAGSDGGVISNNSILTIGTSSTTDTSQFINNYGGGNGGAISNDGTLNIHKGVTFAGNYAAYGGAIYNSSPSPSTIDGNTFKFNGYSNYSSPGGVDTASSVFTDDGGAIFNDINTNLTITNSLFNNNAATVNGGAIQNNGILNSSGNTYAGNFTPGDGGAVYNPQNAILTSIGDTFRYNGYSDYNGTNATTIATQHGGAIHNEGGGVVKITNSSFTNNSATSNGGAIFNNANGRIYIQSDGIGNQTLFQNNTANSTSNAIYMAGTDSSTNSSNVYLNAGNSGRIIINDGLSSSGLAYNNLFINSTDSTASTSFLSDGKTLTNGEVDLYGDVSGLNINAYTGTLNIGSSSSTPTFTNDLLIVSGGATNITNATFKNNTSPNDGGAIYNNGGTINITNSRFNDNISSNNGGTIYNNTSTINIGASGSTDTTSFVNNYAANLGGAIYNNLGTLNSYGGVTYAGNYTGTSGNGGAIYNTGLSTVATIIENIFEYNGYSNYNSTNATTVATQNGGAIYNDTGGVVKIANSSFTNNAATINGGAIFNNENGRIYIQADGTGKQTVFQNNTANSASNAIYQAGTSSNYTDLYLNAGNSGRIYIHDGISGSDISYNNIYINSSDAIASTSFINPTNTLTSGDINLYGNITGNTIYDYSGKTYFGQSGTPNTGFYNGTSFNLLGGTQDFYNGISGATINSSAGTQNIYSLIANSTLNLNGGTFKLASGGDISSSTLNLNSGNFNIANGVMDTVAITNFTANPLAILTFDADLSNGTSDRLTVSGSATGTLNASVNVIKDALINGSSTITLISGSNISELTLNDIATTYTTYKKYTFTGSNNGTYNVTADWANGLNSAVAVDTLTTRSFSATADSSAIADLGTMGKADSELNIYGNNHKINGLGYSGVNVLSGQSLTIADASSWNGFNSLNGGAINNSGTTTITNSTFTNNTALGNGGVIYNSAILNISGNSSFISNTAPNGEGGVICNTSSGNVTISDTTFNSNTAGLGAVMSNYGTATINNSIFTSNASNSCAAGVYNAPSGNLTISGSTFTSNTSVGCGAVICNDGRLDISNSTFTSNSTIGGMPSGAICDDGSANISNTTFISNSAEDGGAIHIGVYANITGSTFITNSANNGGGAISNDGQTDISSSTFTSNSANLGGALQNGATTNINDSTFNLNTAGQNGGAIFNDTNGVVKITNSSFTKNSATNNGGAIYNKGSLTIGTEGQTDTSLFKQNNSGTNGGTIYNTGTLTSNAGVTFDGNYLGIYNTGNSAIANISNNTFNSNGNNGQDITQCGSAITNGSDATANITGSTFNNNIASYAGGAIQNVGVMNITSSTFNSNSAWWGGGAIQNLGKTSVTSSIFDSNNAGYAGGAIYIYQNPSIGSISQSTFTNNYAQDDGGAIGNWLGQTTIDSSTFKGNYTTNTGNWTGLGGAICNLSYAASSDFYVKNSTFEGNGVKNYGSTNAQNPETTMTQYGGAISNNGDQTAISNLTVINTTFTNNKATRLGGAIHNYYGNLNIIADGGNTSFSGNTDASGPNDIYLDTNSTLNLNAGNGGKITFGGGIKSNGNDNIININKSATYSDGITTKTAPTDGEIVLNNPINGATVSIDPTKTISNINPTVNLYSGTLSLGNDSYLNGSNLVLASDNSNSTRTLNLINNNIGTMALNSLAINANSNLKIDVNLANGTADKITSASGITGSGKLNINGINLLNDSTTKTTTANLTTDPTMASHITLGLDKAYTPMYQYNVAYDGSGNLSFVNPGASDYTKFNPTVLSSQISTSVGAYMNQVNIYNEVLSRADTFMSLPQTERLLMRYRNMYANVGGNDVQPEVFSPTYLPDENAGLWVKQYTTFENIPLNNGPNVSNVGYGAIVGGDTPMQHLGHGMDGYLTFYAGYNGSHQNYDSVGVNQNGGALGVTGTLYKGNLFTTMTASAGDSYGQANTPYGVDNFNTLLAGLAWKTGYNFEIDRGKFILQPSFLTAYTFAKTFDYQTASGVNVTSDPLNALQLAPGLKFIYNGHDGWQPYLTTNMIWNLMDVQKFYANDAQLPQMSVAPYFEYGAGVQRRWGERFTGFGQALLRGGGRNGLALQFGFRYALGK